MCMWEGGKEERCACGRWGGRDVHVWGGRWCACRRVGRERDVHVGGWGGRDVHVGGWGGREMCMWEAMCMWEVMCMWEGGEGEMCMCEGGEGERCGYVRMGRERDVHVWGWGGREMCMCEDGEGERCACGRVGRERCACVRMGRERDVHVGGWGGREMQMCEGGEGERCVRVGREMCMCESGEGERCACLIFLTLPITLTHLLVYRLITGGEKQEPQCCGTCTGEKWGCTQYYYHWLYMCAWKRVHVLGYMYFMHQIPYNIYLVSTLDVSPSFEGESLGTRLVLGYFMHQISYNIYLASTLDVSPSFEGESLGTRLVLGYFMHQISYNIYLVSTSRLHLTSPPPLRGRAWERG